MQLPCCTLFAPVWRRFSKIKSPTSPGIGLFALCTGKGLAPQEPIDLTPTLMAIFAGVAYFVFDASTAAFLLGPMFFADPTAAIAGAYLPPRTGTKEPQNGPVSFKTLHGALAFAVVVRASSIASFDASSA